MMDIIPPIQATNILGHTEHEAMFADQLSKNRLPHAMLFCGAKGIGKVSTAFRLAKYMAVGPKQDSGMDSLFGGPEPSNEAIQYDTEHPAVSRIEQGSHGDVMVIQPQWDDRKKAYKNDIVVDDVRKVGHFLAHTPSECDYRIVIVDSADALNVSAANALLKVLEEPPKNAYLFLMAHHPGNVLQTIRSRCRAVNFSAPNRDDFERILSPYSVEINTQDALYALSEGSPGFALSLIEANALELYGQQIEAAERADFSKVKRFSDYVLSRKDPTRWKMFQHCWMHFLSRIAQSGVHEIGVEYVPGEKQSLLTIAQQLKPDAWHRLWEDSAALFSRTDGVYLDPKITIQQLFGALRGQPIRI